MWCSREYMETYWLCLQLVSQRNSFSCEDGAIDLHKFSFLCGIGNAEALAGNFWTFESNDKYLKSTATNSLEYQVLLHLKRASCLKPRRTLRRSRLSQTWSRACPSAYLLTRGAFLRLQIALPGRTLTVEPTRFGVPGLDNMNGCGTVVWKVSQKGFSIGLSANTLHVEPWNGNESNVNDRLTLGREALSFRCSGLDVATVQFNNRSLHSNMHPSIMVRMSPAAQLRAIRHHYVAQLDHRAQNNTAIPVKFENALSSMKPVIPICFAKSVKAQWIVSESWRLRSGIESEWFPSGTVFDRK